MPVAPEAAALPEAAVEVEPEACIAGSQSTGGDTAHGGGSGDFQKAFAGDLVHSGFLLFLFLCLFVIFGSALWKNLHRTNKNSLAYL